MTVIPLSRMSITTSGRGAFSESTSPKISKRELNNDATDNLSSSKEETSEDILFTQLYEHRTSEHMIMNNQ